MNKHDRLNDELLVLRCQQRDAEAFEELIGRWQRRLWQHAWRLTGDDSAAWDGKGLVLKNRQMAGAAIAAFMQATRITPDRAWLWEHLAEALNDEARYADALPVLQQALRLAPEQAPLWMKQGQTLRALTPTRAATTPIISATPPPSASKRSIS